MPKKDEEILELECQPDPKNKDHLICETKGSALVQKSEEPHEDEKEEKSEKKTNLFIGAINIGTQPVKEFFRSRWEKFYLPEKKYSRWHLTIDLLLVFILLGALVFNFYLLFQKPENLPEQIDLRVQPESLEITLGEAKDLNFLFVNRSNEKLEEVKISFWLPNLVHFIQAATSESLSPSLVFHEIKSKESQQFKVSLRGEAKGKGEIFVLINFLGPKGEFYQKTKIIPLEVTGTNLQFLAYARYFSQEGEQLGRGPLPPRVGEKTKYQIFWVLEKINLPLKNLFAEGYLADNVFWENFVPQEKENLFYDPLTKKITWRIGDILDKEELNLKSRGTIFEIALQPDESQINQEVPLIQNIKIKGFNALNNQPIFEELQDITTNLIFDKRAQGKSKVGK